MAPRDAELRRVRRALLGWYDREHRDFPWRATRDPWGVLVSEVMLQQTQAARVERAFPAFLARFPTPGSLARASSAEVLAAWSGLGYNRRALALRAAAEVVERDGWPRDVAGLQQLPGIGPYTARAIASLAFDEPAGVVDTNVRRWLVRRFGLAPQAAPRELQALADRLARAGTDGRADAWTHASMEFGAAVCRAARPDCAACPISRGCPSRGVAARVPVARQPAFAGSDRAIRGRILRELSRAAHHRLPLREALAGLTAPDRDRVLDGLRRDGLVHVAGGELRLGSGDAPAAGRDAPATAATIDA